MFVSSEFVQHDAFYTHAGLAALGVPSHLNIKADYLEDMTQVGTIASAAWHMARDACATWHKAYYATLRELAGDLEDVTQVGTCDMTLVHLPHGT